MMLQRRNDLISQPITSRRKLLQALGVSAALDIC